MKLDQPWLKDPAVQKVVQAIKAAGGEARFVGGCVRDAILGRKLGDFDLATTLRPEAVQAACEKAGCKVVPTGIKHGTVTVIADHQVFEVTTLRRDVATDGRWAEVEYTNDWQQDAARRDFTMNALFCDADGNVTDFFGGIDDLKAGLVRFVGEPEQRIKEDVLRILRFFRFFAHYGKGEPDASGLAACKALVSLLPALSVERVRTELLKLLQADNPVPTWQLMLDIGVFKALDLPLGNIERLDQVVRHENTLSSQRRLGSISGQPDGVGMDASLRWHDKLSVRRLWATLERDYPEIGAKLRLSNDEAQRLKALSNFPLPFAGEEKGGGIYRLAYAHGVQAVLDALIVSGQATAPGVEQLMNWKKPHFPLNGADLAKLGVEPGPRMGEILSKVEQWWIDRDFVPDHQKLTEFAKKV